jgi:DNA-binding protein H-NS
MNRIQFLIVTILSCFVALCIISQLCLSWSLTSKETSLRQTEAALQQGEADANHLQQIATRIAQLAQQQNDEQLRDLLTRQNIKINNGGSTNAAPAAPATPSSSH